MPDCLKRPDCNAGSLRFSPFIFGGLFLFLHRVKEQTTFNRKVKGKNNMKKAATNNSEEPKAAPTYQNLVRLVGFLGDQPEQHETRAILSLATKTSWKAKDSEEWQHHTEWHRVVAWDKLAEAVKSFAKGDHVLVEGELSSSTYERKPVGGNGVVAIVKAWEIRARAIRKLEHKKKKKPAKATAYADR